MKYEFHLRDAFLNLQLHFVWLKKFQNYCPISPITPTKSGYVIFLRNTCVLGALKSSLSDKKRENASQRCHRSKEAGNLEVSSNCLGLSLTSSLTYYLNRVCPQSNSLWKMTSRSAYRCAGRGPAVTHLNTDPAKRCLTWVIARYRTPTTHRTLSVHFFFLVLSLSEKLFIQTPICILFKLDTFIIP